jgi:hypothetical protein
MAGDARAPKASALPLVSTPVTSIDRSILLVKDSGLDPYVPGTLPCEVVLPSGRLVMSGLTASLSRTYQQVRVGCVAGPLWRWHEKADLQRLEVTPQQRLRVVADLGLGAASEQQLVPIRGGHKDGFKNDGVYTVPKEVGEALIGPQAAAGRTLQARVVDSGGRQLQQLELTTHKPTVQHLASGTSHWYRVAGLSRLFQQLPGAWITSYTALEGGGLELCVHQPAGQDASSRQRPLTYASQAPAGAAQVVGLQNGTTLLCAAAYFQQRLGALPDSQHLRLPCRVLLRGQVVLQALPAELFMQGQQVAVGGVGAAVQQWYPGAELLGLELCRSTGTSSSSLLQLHISWPAAGFSSHSGSPAAAGHQAARSAIRGPLKVGQSVSNQYYLPIQLCRRQPQLQVESAEAVRADVLDSSGRLLQSGMQVMLLKPQAGQHRVSGLSDIWFYWPDSHITDYGFDSSSGRLQVQIHRGPAPLPAADRQQQGSTAAAAGPATAAAAPAAAPAVTPAAAPAAHRARSRSPSTAGGRPSKRQRQQQQAPSSDTRSSLAELAAAASAAQLAHLVAVLQRCGTPAGGGPLPLARLPCLTGLLHWGALEALLEEGEAAGLLKRSGGGAAGGGGGGEEVRVRRRLLRRLEAGSAAGGAAQQEAKHAARAALGLAAGPLPAAGTDAWALLQRRLAGFAAWWLSQRPGGSAERRELQRRLRRLCGSWTRAGAVVALLLEWGVAEEDVGETEGESARVVLT